MAQSEWLRTFVAIYRTQSISKAAVVRGISQPAASQQLAKLETMTGTPLFHRHRGGLEPTLEARRLYDRVAGALDVLEPTFAALEVGTLPPEGPDVRIGCTSAFPAELLVSRLQPTSPRVSITFASHAELVSLLYAGQIDVAVTPEATRMSRESAALRAARATTVHVADVSYVLLVARSLAPSTPLVSLEELGAVLDHIPWVSYSTEVPVTRRFMRTYLRRPFSGHFSLTVPDLRILLRAIERGVGTGFIPRELCESQLHSGTLVELFPMAEYIPTSAVFATVREGETARPEIAAVLGLPLDDEPGA